MNDVLINSRGTCLIRTRFSYFGNEGENIMGKNKKVTFKVSGMHCNGCSASIGKALSRLDGIEHAEADFQKGIADVAYNEKAIEKEKIIETIEDLGYKVEGES